MEPHRSEGSGVAAWRVLDAQPEGARLVSIGGGPTRAHPRLVNLNIALLPNVDVVADAYRLPFRDGAIDAIHCEAVLEHLERPDAALEEMCRVLRPGGALFAVTPFLQPFHAYPGHYQNYTLEGHRRLVERQGFEVLAAGVCVGPTYALVELFANYAREMMPGGFAGRVFARGIRALGGVARLADRRLVRRPNAHILCSTTYVHGEKPSAPRPAHRIGP